MEIKRLVMLFVFVFLLLALVACERPASTPPGGEATATTAPGDFPVPGSTDDVMSQLEAFATQTEMAMQGGGTSQAAEPSPTPGGEIAATSPATEATQPAGETSPTQAPTTAPPAQPTNPPAPVPTKTPGIPKTHTLRSGEFPYCIARRFDVNPNEMLRLSGLSGSGTFPAGTKLKIPQSGNKFPGNRSLKSHPTTYTVRSGDTIYTIACSFGVVDPNDIIAANNLTSPYKLSPGQSLHIP